MFGLDGLIVKFVGMMFGLFVVCCGDMFVVCMWGDMGIGFMLDFINGFVCWVVLFVGGVVGSVVVLVEL